MFTFLSYFHVVAVWGSQLSVYINLWSGYFFCAHFYFCSYGSFNLKLLGSLFFITKHDDVIIYDIIMLDIICL